MAAYSESELQAARDLEVDAQARLDRVNGQLATATGADANALCRQAHSAYRDLGQAHFVLSDDGST
ncbi:hypothetical protein [Streptomyces sp. NPDC056682]|uniref:hypothetical protein n=1 Tax=Streptomyces sp. NPDC056682 TaxID=3345909 RepID=UPI0036B15832